MTVNLYFNQEFISTSQLNLNECMKSCTSTVTVFNVYILCSEGFRQPDEPLPSEAVVGDACHYIHTLQLVLIGGNKLQGSTS